MSALRGVFITIDGPSGVGKSSIIKIVAQLLRDKGFDVLETKEPTAQFPRDNEETYRGRKLLDLIVADRKYHLEKEIVPALTQGALVISDRYIESSLVYQRMDDLDLELIWSLNKEFLVPDLSIIILASPSTISARLQDRSKLSRFEREFFRDIEIQFYKNAVTFLKDKDYTTTIVVENERESLQSVAKEVFVHVKEALKHHEK